MTLPGGPADKRGNRYEELWTISELVNMLMGFADSIRIEDPIAQKAEFVVMKGGLREFHQAKRANQSGKWSLAALAAKDTALIQAIGSSCLAVRTVSYSRLEATLGSWASCRRPPVTPPHSPNSKACSWRRRTERPLQQTLRILGL
jgi:hypothetical protein